MAVTGLSDGVLTLMGNIRNWGWEISPLWRWFLHRGPLPFGVAFLGYLAVIGTIVACAPLRLSKVLCVIMVLAHTNGMMSWLRLVGLAYYFEPLIYALIAVVTVVAVAQDPANMGSRR